MNLTQLRSWYHPWDPKRSGQAEAKGLAADGVRGLDLPENKAF